MAINDQLIETFNNCIERLNRGESIDTILSDYPDLATQLSPMLEAGLVVKKARYPVADVTAAQDKLSPQIQATIDATFGGGSTSINWFGVILILLLLGSIIASIYSLNREPHLTLATATATSLQESPTMMGSLTATIPITPTLEQTMDVVTIIEGPVSNIQGNIITIYEQDIQLAPRDPRLAVMQLGDVLRVETSQDDQSTISLDITFVNVLVVVNNSGQIWRGDDCNNPPPNWIDGDTSSWFVQCNAGNPNNNSANPDSGGDDDDD